MSKKQDRKKLYFVVRGNEVWYSSEESNEEFFFTKGKITQKLLEKAKKAEENLKIL